MNDNREAQNLLPELANPALLPELRMLIVETRRSVAHHVNSALVQLYWQIGTRIDIGVCRKAEQSMANKLSLRWGDNCS